VVAVVVAVVVVVVLVAVLLQLLLCGGNARGCLSDRVPDRLLSRSATTVPVPVLSGVDGGGGGGGGRTRSEDMIRTRLLLRHWLS